VQGEKVDQATGASRHLERLQRTSFLFERQRRREKQRGPQRKTAFVGKVIALKLHHCRGKKEKNFTPVSVFYRGLERTLSPFGKKRKGGGEVKVFRGRGGVSARVAADEKERFGRFRRAQRVKNFAEGSRHHPGQGTIGAVLERSKKERQGSPLFPNAHTVEG